MEVDRVSDRIALKVEFLQNLQDLDHGRAVTLASPTDYLVTAVMALDNLAFADTVFLKIFFAYQSPIRLHITHNWLRQSSLIQRTGPFIGNDRQCLCQSLLNERVSDPEY